MNAVCMSNKRRKITCCGRVLTTPQIALRSIDTVRIKMSRRSCAIVVKMKLVIFLALQVVAVTLAADCDSGWEAYGHSCYKFQRRETNFENAKTRCEAKGAHLVRIEDANENDWIRSQIDTIGANWWIGLNDKETEGTFVWNDCPGQQTHFTNWMSGEPNQHDGNQEDCVQIIHSSGEWNDVPCSKTIKFICEKPTTEMKTCCSTGMLHQTCSTVENLDIRDLCPTEQSDATCSWNNSYYISDNDAENPNNRKFSTNHGCCGEFRVYF
ncbi:hypothetical protein ScPMuIL_014682 [Solemya velum]